MTYDIGIYFMIIIVYPVICLMIYLFYPMINISWYGMICSEEMTLCGH